MCVIYVGQLVAFCYGSLSRPRHFNFMYLSSLTLWLSNWMAINSHFVQANYSRRKDPAVIILNTTNICRVLECLSVSTVMESFHNLEKCHLRYRSSSLLGMKGGICKMGSICPKSWQYRIVHLIIVDNSQWFRSLILLYGSGLKKCLEKWTYPIPQW